MRLIWSPLVTQNAHTLASFIAQDKPVVAIKWLEDLFERIELLQVLPESGRIVPEVANNSIREVIFGQYRVIYQLAGKQIMILTVRHGKQLLNQDSLRIKDSK